MLCPVGLAQRDLAAVLRLRSSDKKSTDQVKNRFRRSAGSTANRSANSRVISKESLAAPADDFVGRAHRRVGFGRAALSSAAMQARRAENERIAEG
jgi:hypothetical protein